MDEEVITAAEEVFPESEAATALIEGTANTVEVADIGAAEWIKAVHQFSERCGDLVLRETAAHGGEEAAVLDDCYEAIMALHLLRLLSRAIAAVHESRTPIAADDTPSDVYRHVLRQLYWACYLVSGEIAVLLRSGYAIGAFARWRTLHEMSLRARAVALGGRGVAQAFLDHEKMRDTSSSRELYGVEKRESGSSRFDPEQLRADEAANRALRERYGPTFSGDWGWLHEYLYNTAARYRSSYDEGQRERGPRFSDVLRAISDDPQYTRISELNYNLACSAVHGSPAIAFDPTVGRISRGPSQWGLAEVGIATVADLGRVTHTYALTDESDLRMSRLRALLNGVIWMTRDKWDAITDRVLDVVKKRLSDAQTDDSTGIA
jgi:hypothetical protein